MKISDKGLAIIKEFEGYARKLPNGDCTAYQDYLGNGKYDISTIGWGCTEGVKMGDVWTVAQAEEGLKREISKFEDAVLRLCKFTPTQNQFDALVSFTYNVGEGALAKSTVLRLANTGDFQGASRAFLMWNKAQGVTLAGLTRRRNMEAALFLEAPLATNEMPSQVDEPSEGFGSGTTSVLNNTQSTVAAGGLGTGILGYFGLAPDAVLGFLKTYPFELLIGGALLIFVITESFKYFKGDHQ